MPISHIDPQDTDARAKMNSLIDAVNAMPVVAGQIVVNTGEDDEKIVTPLKLKTHLDTTRRAGQTVVNAGEDNSAFITPLTLKAHLDTVRVAGQTAVNDGAATNVYIVPATLAALLDTVRKASAGEVTAGTVDNKFVTPAKLQGKVDAVTAAYVAAIATETSNRNAAIAASEISRAAASSRPGYNPTAFQGSPSADPTAGQADGVSVQTSRGWARRLTGAGRIRTRVRYPVIDGITWKATVSLVRETDPTDPAGDQVDVFVVWLGNDGNSVSAARVFPEVNGTPLTVADGPQIVEWTFGGPSADEVAPGTAVDAVVYVQTYGSDGVTDVNVVHVEEAPGPLFQDALDAKAPLESPTFSGTVAGISKAMVGLGNVDNTADADKPISTATAAALAGKADASSLASVATTGSAADLSETADAKVFTGEERTKLADVEPEADVTDAGNVGASVAGTAALSVISDEDSLPILDESTSNTLRRVTWSTIVARIAALPLSSAVVSALAGKSNVGHTHTTASLTGTSDDITQGSANLFMQTGERTKLADVEPEADVTDAGNVGAAVAGTAALSVISDEDSLPILDESTSNTLRRVTWSTIVARIAALPLSSAVVSALAGKSNVGHTHTTASLTGTSDDITQGSANLFMQTGERSKLASVAQDADVTSAGSVGAVVTGVAALSAPDNADTLPITDTSASNGLRKLTFANLWSWIQGLADARYARSSTLGSASTADASAFAAASHQHAASAISDSTTAGRAILTGADAAAQRASLGLGTAALTAAADYATAAQGAKADTAESLYRGVVSGARDAPGLGTDLFTQSLTGKAADAAPLTVGAPAASEAYGSTWRIEGADIDGGFIDVAPRHDFVYLPGRVYRVRMIVERVVDPIDPLSDAVEVRIQNLSKLHASISNVRYGLAHTVTVAGGALDVSFTIGREPPGGVSVDYEPPATARHVRPFVRIYGGAPAVTDVVLVSVVDVTEAEIAAADGFGIAVEDLASSVMFAEHGTSVTPELSWSIVGDAPVASLTINGTPLALDAEAWTAPAPITNDTAYTVVVTGTNGKSDAETLVVDFRHRVFWGASASPTLGSAEIIALASSALAAEPGRSMTIDASGGKYPFYAYPTIWGLPPNVSLFGFGVEPEITTVAVTTAVGFSTSYYLVRGPEPLIDSNALFEVE